MRPEDTLEKLLHEDGVDVSSSAHITGQRIKEDEPPSAPQHTPEQVLAIRKSVDLIDLPQDVQGANCGNCRFIDQDKDFCNHPDIQVAVNPRMCCVKWDAPGVGRPWLQGQEAPESKLESLLDPAKQLQDLLEAKPGWSRYKGPRGGHGWKSNKTGVVRYQEEMPGEHEHEGPSDEPDEPHQQQSAKPSFSKWEIPPHGSKEGDTYYDAAGMPRRVVKNSRGELFGQADFTHKDILDKLSKYTAEEKKAAAQYAMAKTEELKKDVKFAQSVTDWNMYRDLLMFAYVNTHKWNHRFQRERGLSPDKAHRTAAALSNLDHIIGMGAFASSAASAMSSGGARAVPGSLSSPGFRAALVPWATLSYLTLQGVRHPVKVMQAAGRVVGDLLHKAHKERGVERRWLGARQRRAKELGQEPAMRGRPRAEGRRIGDVIVSPEGERFKIVKFIPGRPTLARAQDDNGDLVDIDIYKRRRVQRRNPNIQDSIQANEQSLSTLLYPDPVNQLRILLEEEESSFNMSPEDMDAIVDAFEEYPDDWFGALLITAAGEMDDVESAISLAEDAYEQTLRPPLDSMEAVDWAEQQLGLMLA